MPAREDAMTLDGITACPACGNPHGHKTNGGAVARNLAFLCGTVLAQADGPVEVLAGCRETVRRALREQGSGASR